MKDEGWHIETWEGECRAEVKMKSEGVRMTEAEALLTIMGQSSGLTVDSQTAAPIKLYKVCTKPKHFENARPAQSYIQP